MTQAIERPFQSYDPTIPAIEWSRCEDEPERLTRCPITEAEYSGLTAMTSQVSDLAVTSAL
jgi:hypothetical protein